MARKSRHSIQKRQRELRKREKQDAKRLKKAARAAGELPEDGEEEGIEFDENGLPIPTGLPLEGAASPPEDEAEAEHEKEESEVSTPL